MSAIEGKAGVVSREKRPELDAMVRRVEADLRYLRDWSPGLDIGILLRTVLRLGSRDVY